MKRSPLLLLLPALFAVAAAYAANPQARVPIRPVGECIDSTGINEWHIVNDTTLLVRTGPKRYLVKTRNACPRLGRYGTGIRFRPSNDKQVTLPGRICGDVGETVSSRAQPPCAVQSVQRIDTAQFEALRSQAVRHGNGAGQGVP
ncbi:MAG TPA: DUF6491 family protein [Rhodanobacteraceae bacterium]|jgi:hypothetical protein|nr:DUF6491 family protein [Rhodanobacteraceae bacterium]